MSRSGKLWIRDQICFIFIFGISCEELAPIWSYIFRGFVLALRGGQQILVFVRESKTTRKNLVFVLFSSPGSFVRGWRSKYGAIHHFLWPQTTLLGSIIMSHDHHDHRHCHNLMIISLLSSSSPSWLQTTLQLARFSAKAYSGPDVH